MAEYESLNMERYPGAEMPRSWNERMLLGGGYYQQFGERGGSMMGIFYDVFYRYGSSPFPSPWVMRFGFTF